MKSLYLRKNLHERKLRRMAAVFAAVLFSSAVATTWADALYLITGASETAIVLEDTSPVPDLSSQLINVTTGVRGYEITLAAGQTVNIRHNGAILSVQSKNETVSALLDRLHIVPSPLQMVAADLAAPGVTLTVSSDITYYDTVVEEAPYSTRRVANPDMAAGSERVVQQGQKGLRTSLYEVVWSNGVQLSRQFVEELSSTAVEEVVEYGTAVQSVTRDDPLVNVVTNPDGSAYDPLTFAHEFGHFCNDYVCGGSYAGTDVAEVFSQGMEYLSLCYGKADSRVRKLKMLDCLNSEELTVENVQALYEQVGTDFGFPSWNWDSRDFVTMPHYFTNPMYIISYVVSNDAAFQLYQLEQAEEGSGLARYEAHLQSEESYFLSFLESAGLESPFAPGRLREVKATFESALAGVGVETSPVPGLIGEENASF